MFPIFEKLIRQRGLILFALVLLLNHPIWTDDIDSVWPTPSTEQWYWYEPDSSLSPDQVSNILNNVALSQTHFRYSKYFNSLFTLQESRLDLKKNSISSAAIRIKTTWVGINEASGRGSKNLTIPLASISNISLFYSSRGKNEPWYIKLLLNDDSSFIFYFKDEMLARQFGSALGSALSRQGLSLKIPRLGIITGDLSPGQAEAIGKSRIENMLLIDVAIDGPADQAGLRTLDVITEFNGVTIKNKSHFLSIVESMASGENANITFLRREKATENDKEHYIWTQKTVKITAR
ncbi:PDZ domain-containing protein [Gracilinema caldarium]|uniref:PDZ/DHR/GLGF domain protein n=1 Tax=Gracilinema caldarium (strain ATCC 51460 / DSM 7334 / H1) TaxID=744872 RepID=F8F330_GRAC1|nr:PDZ domain-containing protein [Gracilinema caldarium]AEJ19938.1 PDZ/DHR/GLGF domain protein [Gracilinema caldarium DSM 7334]